MKTTYTLYPLTAEPTHHEIDWPEDPGYDRIKRLVEPLINGEPLEHVTVLHDGRRHDMFVSEIGHQPTSHRGWWPRNEPATAIYRCNWLTQHPEADPEDLPWIAGPAVLFHRIVWGII